MTVGHRWLLLLAALLGSTESATRAVDLPLPFVESVSLHGYYKNFVLGLDSSEPFLQSGLSDLNRARLMLRGRFSTLLDFAVHYEHFAVANPIQGSGLFVGPVDRPGVYDLSWSIVSSEQLTWFHDIDRLYIRARPDWGDVTIGRQAIGWGVGLIWAPLDLLGGFSPVQIDREFRIGVDAARVLVALGPFSEAEAVYAVYDSSFDEQVAAARWRGTIVDLNLDVGVVAGKFFDDAVAGVLMAGEVRGIGLHGSVNATHHYGGGEEIGPRNFARAVLGADYRFRGDVTVLGEYYFNGWGSSNPDDYLERLASPRIRRGEIFNLGRHYLGFVADWQAHPLVHLLAQGQCNLLDPSAQVGPALTLSLTDEAQLDGGAFFALGAGSSGLQLRSEFGSAPNFYYLAVKIYF